MKQGLTSAVPSSTSSSHCVELLLLDASAMLKVSLKPSISFTPLIALYSAIKA